MRNAESVRESVSVIVVSVIVGTLFFPAVSFGALMAPLALSSETEFVAPRWVYGQGEPPRGDSLSAHLGRAHRAEADGDFTECVKEISNAWSKAKSIQPWVLALELECSEKLKLPADRASHLARVLTKVEKNPGWLLAGPSASLLRTNTVLAYLALIEQDIKGNRKRAEKSIETLEGILSFADDKAKAKLWRFAGEMMFQQQKRDEAREFFKRSLSEADSEEARSRLSLIERSMNTASPDTPEKSDEVKPVVEVKPLDASADEIEMIERVTNSLKSGDLAGGVSDAVKLINQFPGSTRAKWAQDRVLETYTSLIDKTDSKQIAAKASIVRDMERADADRVADWSRSMFSRGQWDDALQLARRAVDTTTGVRQTAVLDLAAKCAVASDRQDLALDFSKRLINQHAGTQSSREALFRTGLIRYRNGGWAPAAADFEKLLALPQVGALEMSARYWLWRSLQKLKSERADSVADELMRKFAFGYYGLRARYERHDGKLEWKEQKAEATSKLWLTEAEKKSYERAHILLEAGWLEEAQAELKELPLPMKAEDKAVRALLWAAAGGHTTASRLANEAWDEKYEFRRSPFIGAAFPKEFASQIATQASARKMDPALLFGLIKQESGFSPRVTSSANAMGLMQMVPATAREVARDLRLGPLEIPEDMFKPARNIQMGTFYLSRLLTKYQGHVPLALAAYNAGPARIDRWLKLRPSLKKISETKSSAPEDEIWIDELPYQETTVYVKSILRNLLIYKMLDQGRVQISNPVWGTNATDVSNP